MLVYLQARRHLTMAGQNNSEPPGLHDLGHSVDLTNGQETAQTAVEPPVVIRNGAFVYEYVNTGVFMVHVWN